MAEQKYNRYRNDSDVAQTFFVDGQSIRIIPGGTAVAPVGSTVAKSRFTVIVQRNVEVPNYEDQEADWEEQEDTQPEVPQHENDNPTNTSPSEGGRTILTDEFDGSGGQGAVNTSAARPVYVEPETPKPEADLTPQQQQAAESENKTVASKTGKTSTKGK